MIHKQPIPHQRQKKVTFFSNLPFFLNNKIKPFPTPTRNSLRGNFCLFCWEVILSLRTGKAPNIHQWWCQWRPSDSDPRMLDGSTLKFSVSHLLSLHKRIVSNSCESPILNHISLFKIYDMKYRTQFHMSKKNNNWGSPKESNGFSNATGCVESTGCPLHAWLPPASPWEKLKFWRLTNLGFDTDLSCTVYQRKFGNLTSDYTESCCWRSWNQEMWSRRCDTAEMWDMRIWRVGSAQNAVFFHSFVASLAGKVSS